MSFWTGVLRHHSNTDPFIALASRREEQRVVVLPRLPTARTRDENCVVSEVELEVNRKVNERLQAKEDEIRSEQIPLERARIERELTYMEALAGLLVMVALDPKKFDLTAAALIPLDD